jgi:hypothetical protein
VNLNFPGRPRRTGSRLCLAPLIPSTSSWFFLSMPTLAFYLLLGLACVVFMGCGDSDKTYVEKNEAILKSLLAFPGSTEDSRESNSYRHGGSGPIAGYGTRVYYRLGSLTTEQEIREFYETNMDGSWVRDIHEIPINQTGESPASTPGPPGAPGRRVETVIQFCREEAFVAVNTLNVGMGLYDVYVDHRAFQQGIRGPCN